MKTLYLMFTIELVGNALVELVGAFAQLHVTHGATPRVILGESFTDDSFMDDSSSNVQICCGVGATEVLWDGQDFRITVDADTSHPLPVMNRERYSCHHETVTLMGPSRDAVMAFLNAAQRHIERQVPDRFRTLSWDAQCEHWRRQGAPRRRPWVSMIMDDNTENIIVNDLTEFFSEETRAWYESHGIPYRRGFLFYGPPGTGKTSCISALASRFGCNVYKLNLVAKGLTDDSLQMAINTIKKRALVVLEDADCLFDTHREKTDHNAVITFSGLLNAVDGLQTTQQGTIFIFTTNHRERLDAALRRKGRIDMELSFDVCTVDQTKRMFKRFYPDATAKEMETFVTNVRRAHSSTMPTPADLQEFFVRCRKTPSGVACHNVSFDATTSRCLDMWT